MIYWASFRCLFGFTSQKADGLNARGANTPLSSHVSVSIEEQARWRWRRGKGRRAAARRGYAFVCATAQHLRRAVRTVEFRPIFGFCSPGEVCPPPARRNAHLALTVSRRWYLGWRRGTGGTSVDYQADLQLRTSGACPDVTRC